MHRSIQERVPYGEKTTRRAVMGLRSLLSSSSETQGQIVGAWESINRRKNMAQKKSEERQEEPLGTMSYQTSSKRSPPFWLLIGDRKLDAQIEEDCRQTISYLKGYSYLKLYCRKQSNQKLKANTVGTLEEQF